MYICERASRAKSKARYKKFKINAYRYTKKKIKWSEKRGIRFLENSIENFK